MHIPLVDLKAQYETIQLEINEAIVKVIEKTSFILGQDVKSFEEEFAHFCNNQYAIGISSGTDAIHLALRALEVGSGDEVITSPFTFIATAEAISMCGAKPVFCDIDPLTYNIDPTQIERHITERTKVIMPVHLYGQPANIEPIMEIAKRYNLLVVEDAAQAHGATYNGVGVGTMSDVACYSFYPGKNLGAYGDAGAVVTNNNVIAQRVRMLRDHGRVDKYEHQIIGYGNRLDAIQAAILRVKLGHLSDWVTQRRKIAEHYSNALRNENLAIPYVPTWTEPAWHLYVIKVADRDTLREFLARENISTGIHYPIPLHLQPAYRELEYSQGDFPIAEAASKEVLSLPLYPEMTTEQIGRVIQAVKHGAQLDN